MNGKQTTKLARWQRLCGGKLPVFCDQVGSLPDRAGKPEALTVLEENDASMTVLVWHDGAKDGALVEMQVRKAAR